MSEQSYDNIKQSLTGFYSSYFSDKGPIESFYNIEHLDTSPPEINKSYDDIKQSLSNLYSSYADKGNVESFDNIEHFSMGGMPRPTPDIDFRFKNEPLPQEIKDLNVVPSELYNVIEKFDLEPSRLNETEKGLRIKYLDIAMNVIDNNYQKFLFMLMRTQQEMQETQVIQSRPVLVSAIRPQPAPQSVPREASWANCVAWPETSPGRHNDWCIAEFGPTAEHIGQTQAGCPVGFGKGVCRTNPMNKSMSSGVGVSAEILPEIKTSSVSSVNREIIKLMIDNAESAKRLTFRIINLLKSEINPITCPACPGPTKCPDAPSCPTCPAIPTCPGPTICPSAPTCPTCTVCPGPTKCPDAPVCPTCPPIPTCPGPTKCPDCPTCPTCPPPAKCPDCPEPSYTSYVIAIVSLAILVLILLIMYFTK